ncbi:MAG TPA: TrbG/VirB9 family P-type conjugative transfer protein [Caulobacteraceae bacterium]|nr:TrbG/VirB9 family P-type conjugative transfer protein [Caulobacteraceae bacterium]
MKRPLIIAAVFCVLCTAQVAAVASAMAKNVDARIRTLMYDPDQVVPLNAVFGYQMMIQFGADERIEDVAIGDGSAWQITPNRGASLLFIKPLEHAAHTNMTVVTDRRSYLFELNAGPAQGASEGQMTYVLRFAYPPEPVVAVRAPPPPPPPPEQRNRAYTYTGSTALLPSVVFDDGKFTYFKWPDSVATPAVFLLANDGSESLADYSYRDGYQVVEQVAQRFRLRDGKEVTTLINDGWRDPTPTDASPRPHDSKTARAARAAQAKATRAAEPQG